MGISYGILDAVLIWGNDGIKKEASLLYVPFHVYMGWLCTYIYIYTYKHPDYFNIYYANIYIYIYIYIYICIYIYIYTYTHTYNTFTT